MSLGDVFRGGWTFLRLLATLRSIDRTLKGLAETQAQRLKLECIKADIAPDALLEAVYAPESPGMVLGQSEGDLAEISRLEAAYRARQHKPLEMDVPLDDLRRRLGIED